MTQSNLIELAKQGDPQAIATLMNRSLQTKGILARVNREGNRLQIQLEAEQVPNREALMAFVQNGLSNLHIENISTVEVAGQQQGQGETAWVQEWQLDPMEAETGIEFISRDNPDVVVLGAPPPAPPRSRPVPPPAPPPPRPSSAPASTPEEEIEAIDLDLDFDEAELFPMREGLSNLTYNALEAEPLPVEAWNGEEAIAPDEDELPPELLAAEAARQVQQEIPASLLMDEDMADLLEIQEGPEAAAEVAGDAQFPTVGELALQGELYPTDTEDPDWDALLDSDDFSSQVTADLPVIPTEITPTPDMEAGDELRITQLDEDEEYIVERQVIGYEDVENNVLTELETEIPADDGEIVATWDDGDDNPHGQMIGSPIAIQPVHPDEAALEQGEGRSQPRLWTMVVFLFLAGWILTLIGLPLLTELRERDPAPTPSPQAEKLRSA